MNRIFLLLISMCSLAFINVSEDKRSSLETINNTKSAYTNIELFEEFGGNPTFTDKSILAEGEIYQIEIPEDGIYKLDFEYLSNTLGLTTINADNISIHGHPGGPLSEIISETGPDDLPEITIYNSSRDGNFSPSDFLLFYAEGPNKTSYHNDNTISKHLNIYSRSSYVYLKVKDSSGLRIQSLANVNDVDQTSKFYDHLSSSEEDKFNLLGDFSGTQGSGQQWFGKILSNQRTERLDDDIDIEGIDLQSPAIIDVAFVGRSEGFSSVELSVDNETFTASIGRSSTGDVEATYARPGNIREEVFLSSANPSLILDYPTTANLSEGWLDYVSIQYRKKLNYRNEPLVFADFSSTNVITYGFQIDGNAVQHIWDISNPLTPIDMEFEQTNEGASFGFESSSLRKFIAFTEADAVMPGAAIEIANQNIHALIDVDLAIVYHPEFKDAADRLAAHREEHDDLKVATVSVFDIYHEFSAGKQDPTAIRNFSKMLYDRSNNFRFLLLLGDGSYDYLGLNPDLPFQSFVPAYETKESLNPLSAFPTDDYYALLSENEGGNLRGAIDIAVGRIPVKTKQEADQVINKIVSYDTHENRFGDWRMRVAFVADDEDANIHLRQADGIAESTQNVFPEFNQEKIYFDAFNQESTPGGARYPEANRRLTNEIFNGLLVTNYLGHGGANGWSQERVLKVADIKDWKNASKLPLVITATCSFTGFDDPALVTAGEEAILNPFGGAVALFSTVRSVYSSQNERLTRSVFDTIFTKVNGAHLEIGEILRRSKNSNSADTININARKFLLIGDPSMKLAIPEYSVQLTHLNGQELAAIETVDTLNALQDINAKGIIVDSNGDVVTDFNGIVFPTLFDKKSTVSTLANDASSRVREFNVQRSRLYKGAATVENGEFDINFTIPIDINYTPGKGKFSFYATDGITMDAGGFYDSFIIAGTNENVSLSDEPPVVEAFLNSFDFESGDRTSRNPTLLIKLADDQGINFTGISIGHDITAVIDGNTQNTFILNEFYTSDVDNSKQGLVTFPLSDLEPGEHTLTVKAFDVANNPSEATISFIVLSPEEGEIDHVSSSPNPMTDLTTFSFEHSFSNEQVQFVIDIYDLKGQLIRSIKTTELATSSISNSIVWDGTDSASNKVPTGIYIYQVKINSALLNNSKESTFEKVVVLN